MSTEIIKLHHEITKLHIMKTRRRLSAVQRDLRRAESALNRHDVTLGKLATAVQGASNHRLTTLEGRLHEALRKVSDLQQITSTASRSLEEVFAQNQELTSVLAAEHL